MPLADAIIFQMRKDQEIKRKLAAYFKLSEASIYRMIYNNDDRFTQLGSLEIIAEHFDYPDIHELVITNVKINV